MKATRRRSGGSRRSHSSPCKGRTRSGTWTPFINEPFALSVTPEYLVKIGLLDMAPDASHDLGRRRQQVMDVVSGFSRTSVLVADEPGEIALGALALPHLFVDLHQTGARHEALCDLIRQHLG